MNRTIVITGASDGIGAAAARALHQAGHEVVVVGCSPEKTRAVAGELGAASYTADFSSLDEVRRLADELGERHPRIDVLAHNAGGLFGRRTMTADGHEMTFQVNHLAPFLLTSLLLPTLVASRASVISTSSLAARAGRLDLDDLDHERGYVPARAYGDAKLANIVFTHGLHQRFGDQGVSAAAFHPGVVASNFAAANRGPAWLVYHTPLRRLLLSSEQGADTLVWLASTTPGQDWTPGLYYERRRPASTNPRAFDDALADGLWAASESMVGLPARD